MFGMVMEVANLWCGCLDGRGSCRSFPSALGVVGASQFLYNDLVTMDVV